MDNLFSLFVYPGFVTYRSKHVGVIVMGGR